MHNRSWKIAAAILLAGLAACNGGGSSVTTLPKTTTDSSSASNTAGSVAPLANTADVTSLANTAGTGSRASTEALAQASAPGNVIAIDAGGGTSGSWVSDIDYSGGQVSRVSSQINTAAISNPAPQAVYQSQRWGSALTYTIPNLSPNGAYTVALHFVESYWNAAGQRVFNVTVNGTRELSNFDILSVAGGANKAIVKQFAGSADSNGRLTIAFGAVRDNATIAAIAVTSVSNTATPPPSGPPGSTGGDVLPWVFSELWSSSSPFRTTVADQKARGASVVPHNYMDALWSQGIAGNDTSANIPIYVAQSTDPLLTTICTKFGGNCNAKNVKVHVPSYAVAQQMGDGHLTVIDQAAPAGPIEMDCWQTTIDGSTLQCSWAGAYTLGTAGTTQGGEGIHGGMAVTTVYATGKEISNGHIDHTLGISVRCLNNASVYPTKSGTDASCDGSLNPPHYGDLVHLLWSPGQIAGSAYSSPCKVVLTALAKYGAFLDDTGNDGMQINTDNDLTYTANPATRALDPWPGIQASLIASGDGYGKQWSSCLNRLGSNDLELLQIPHP